MKILVAGGAGFLGAAMVPRLLERGYEVTVVDLLWFGNHLPASVEVRKQNVFDVTEESLRGYDQVLFLAGLSNDPMAEYAPAENFISNAAAPAYLGYIAKRAGVKRFILASSCSVYGYTEGDCFDETRPAVSTYPYGISKLQGEQSLFQLADKDFSVMALRKGTICGYSPRMRFDLIVNTMFKTAFYEDQITVNNPSIWRPILGMQDAVEAYIQAVEVNPAVTGIFNIASANYTVKEVADQVTETLTGLTKKQIDLRVLEVQDFRNYKVNCDKANDAFGFKPKQNIHDLVRELYQHRASFTGIDQDDYYNIRVFKKLHPGGRFS